jgi:hypothetical protein
MLLYIYTKDKSSWRSVPMSGTNSTNADVCFGVGKKKVEEYRSRNGMRPFMYLLLT